MFSTGKFDFIRRFNTLNIIYRLFKILRGTTKKLLIISLILGILTSVFDGVVLLSLSKVLGAKSNALGNNEITGLIKNIIQPPLVSKFFGERIGSYFSLGFFTIVLFVSKAFWLRYTCRLIALIGKEISQYAFESVLWQDFKLCLKRSNTNIIADLSHVNFALNGVVMPFIELSYSISSVIIISIVIFLNSKVIGLAAASIVFIFYSGILFYLRQRITNMSNRYKEAKRDLVKIQNIGIDCYRNIILNGDTTWLSKLHYDKSEKSSLISSKVLFLQRFPRLIIDLILFGGIVLVLLYYALVNLNINFGFFTFIVLALVRLIPPIQAVYRNFTNIKGNLFALEALLRLGSNKSERLYSSQESGKLNPNIISLKNLTYKFNINDKDLLLKNINLEINSGEHVGIIGPSGSGKSTLLDILAGFIRPSNGIINVNGMDINESNVLNRQWLNSCYLISQNEHIIDGTVSENIIFDDFNSSYSDIHLNKSIKIAFLENVIDNLPNGLNTVIGDSGYQLSGGQKQRIFIARAIYKSRPFLFIDEGTSALDTDTEEQVLKNINQLLESTTIISISHKLSTLKFCTKIFELKNGILFPVTFNSNKS